MVGNDLLPFPALVLSPPSDGFSTPYIAARLPSASRHGEGPSRSISVSQVSMQPMPSTIVLSLPSVTARLGGSRGAGLLERPGIDQSQFSPEPRVEEGGEMGRSRQNLRFGGGDRYRVLLLDHERHTEAQVAAVLPKVVPSITSDEARKCFHESREKGSGLVIVTVKEHAEFYAQIMTRCGLRSSIEPDTDTL